MLVTITNEDSTNDTYWDFYICFSSFLSFLSLPGCTIVDDAEMNECLIGDGNQLTDKFGSLVGIPECHSSQGWTKVADELDVLIRVLAFIHECTLHDL